MAIELDDGTIVRSLPEQVDYLTTKNEENEIAIDNLSARLEAAIAGVLHYKGSVATYDDLPADAEIGDVYNVIDTGSNYAWTGEEWDELGSSVDVSNLVSLDGTQTITGIKTFENGIDFNQDSSIIGPNSGELEITAGNANYTFDDSALIPSIGVDLGSASKKFKDLYLSGGVYLGTTWKAYQSATDVFYLENVGQNTGLKFERDKLYPFTNNYTSLGSSSYNWKNLFLSGSIDFGNNAKIQKDSSNRVNILYNNAVKLKIGGGDAYFASAVVPDSNGVFDLGNSSAKWKDLYLAGNLSDGTNTVNIADLKALIDYAKAQGWIS